MNRFLRLSVFSSVTTPWQVRMPCHEVKDVDPIAHVLSHFNCIIKMRCGRLKKFHKQSRPVCFQL